MPKEFSVLVASRNAPDADKYAFDAAIENKMLDMIQMFVVDVDIADKDMNDGASSVISYGQQFADDEVCAVVRFLLACGATVPRAALRSVTSRQLQCLLVAAGLMDRNSFKQSPQGLLRDDDIKEARDELEFEKRSLVIERALPMCIGLQSLEFPAYVTLQILDQFLPRRLRNICTMHFKWEVITAVKHFHERRQQQEQQQQQKKKRKIKQ